MYKLIAVIITLISAIVIYRFNESPPVPTIPEEQWKDDGSKDTRIHEFSINVSQNVNIFFKYKLIDEFIYS